MILEDLRSSRLNILIGVRLSNMKPLQREMQQSVVTVDAPKMTSQVQDDVTGWRHFVHIDGRIRYYAKRAQNC